jgi:DNA-binding transcriptional MerR regulator/effector-binding domain-containing protein
VNTLVGIGDFSRMTFLSVKALRHYHEVGLLPPAEIDPETGYRRYGLEQVPTAQVIRRLRELGMSLEDVRAVIHAPDVGARNCAISAHLRRMEGELEQTRATVQSLRLLLDDATPASTAITYRVDVPSVALAIREEIAHDDMFPWLDEAFVELHAAVARRTGIDGALFSAELMEDEFGEIVALVPGAGEAGGRVHALELPRVEYAVAVHAGPLEEVDRTYAALGAVVANRTIGVQGHLRENYLSDGRIEICWPVFQTAQA